MGTHKKPEKNDNSNKRAVEKVPLSSLRPRRRGKHHELMREILKELTGLSGDTALKVPLGEISAKDLRSAVFRAATAKNMRISSTSDDENLYVWKKRS